MNSSHRQLFPHQRDAVESMKEVERTRKFVLPNGNVWNTSTFVYGDAIGSGKTFSMLTLIQETSQLCYEPREMNTILQYNARSFMTITPPKYVDVDCTVVIASPSLRSHWMSEGYCVPKLRISRVENIHQLNKVDYSNVDCIVVNDLSMSRLAKHELRYRFKRLIIDEAHCISLPNLTNIVAADTIWLVTATPEVFLGSSSDRYAMRVSKVVTSLSYGMSPHIVVRSNVHLEIVAPIVLEYVFQSTSFQSVLRNYLPSNVVHALDDGDIQSVLSALGIHKQSSISIMDYVTSTHHRDIGRLRSDIEHRISLGLDTAEHTCKLTSLENNMHVFHQRVKDTIEQSTCPICLDDVQQPCMTPCHHLFCGVCLLRCIGQNARCPICRKTVDATEVIALSVDSSPSSSSSSSALRSHSQLVSRCERLRSILAERDTQDRILVITNNWNTRLSVIQDVISSDYPYLALSGGSSTRAAVLDTFKRGACPILVLGPDEISGLDIPYVTKLVLYTPLSEFDKKQAIGRAQRPGRTCPLTIYRFVSAM